MSNIRITKVFTVAGTLLLMLLGTTLEANGQDPGPIGPFVIDVRGSMVMLGQNELVAVSRGLRPGQLAPRGIGLNLGGHAYLYRWRAITFGLGASAHFISTSRTPSENDVDPNGPVIRTRFTAISPQLSFNFGTGDGWSYLSGGLGTSRFNVYPQQSTIPSQQRAGTLNYGGGARWFITPNVAFSLDLRLFAISPVPQQGSQPASPRMTRAAFNLGVSLR